MTKRYKHNMTKNNKGKPVNLKTTKFRTDRIEIDKTNWICYFPSIVKNTDENKFDADLIEFHDLEDKVIKTSFGKGQEHVLELRQGHEPTPAFRAELRLRKTRSMRVNFNFNRYLKEIHHLKDDEDITIRDDNYLPISENRDGEYIKEFKAFPEKLAELYKRKFKRLWPEEYKWLEQIREEPVVKCTLMEIGRELSPLSTQSLEENLNWNGIKSSKRFHDAANTIYLKDEFNEDDFEKTDMDGVSVSVPKLEEITSWESKKPYETKERIKMYNKATGLCRIELSLAGDNVFDSNITLDDIKETLRISMEEVGLYPKSSRMLGTEKLKSLCKAYRIDRQTLYMLAQAGSTWESAGANRVLTKKLLRRGALEKMQRGLYRITPVFAEAMKQAEVYRVGNKVNRLDKILLPKDKYGNPYQPEIMPEDEKHDYLHQYPWDEESIKDRSLNYDSKSGKLGTFEAFIEKTTNPQNDEQNQH